LERAPAGEVPAGAVPSRRFVVFGGGALVALLVPLFVSLGQWQWDKAAVKTARQALLDARAAEVPMLLPAMPVDAEAMRYRRVVVRGVYEPERQILIDNRVHRERAGYHVLTPLRIEGGDATGMYVLVNRGWLPAEAEHRRLPAVDTPAGTVELQATAIVPGTRFFTLGATPATVDWRDPAARVWQNLDLARYRQAVGFPLQPVVLELDAASAGGGFVRDWPRPDARSERHVGYAWQWFGFAAATVGIWLFYLVRPWLHRR
jgi:surfeit locus 1 family protein